MANETGRFEIRIAPAKRLALDALASETGTSSSGLTKLGIDWVLARRALLHSGLPAGGDAFAHDFLGGLHEDIAAGSIVAGIGAALQHIERYSDSGAAERLLARISEIVNSTQPADVQLIGLRSFFTSLSKQETGLGAQGHRPAQQW